MKFVQAPDQLSVMHLAGYLISFYKAKNSIRMLN